MLKGQKRRKIQLINQYFSFDRNDFTALSHAVTKKKHVQIILKQHVLIISIPQVRYIL